MSTSSYAPSEASSLEFGVVVIGVDESKTSEHAFDCKYRTFFDQNFYHLQWSGGDRSWIMENLMCQHCRVSSIIV